MAMKKPQFGRKPFLIGRSLGFVWRAAPGWAVLNATLILSLSALALTQLYIIKLIVDEITNAVPTAGQTWIVGRLAILIGVAAAIMFATLALQSTARFCRESLSQSVADYMQSILHAKSIALSLEYYENPKYFDTLHRAQQEGAFRPVQIVENITTFVQNATLLTGMTGVLIQAHWTIVLLLLGAVLPGALIQLRYSGHLFGWQRQRTATERRAWYLNWVISSDAYAKEVRLLGLGKLLTERFRKLRSELRIERLALVAKRVRWEIVGELFTVLTVFGALFLLAQQALTQAISVGAFVMYLRAFQSGQGNLDAMMSVLARLYEDNLFLKNLFEFIDLPSESNRAKDGLYGPAPLSQEIVLEDVSFKYPGSDKFALRNIHMEIRRGEILAIVGRNGSGKTTLIKLLSRLYSPTQGRITWNGTDFEELDLPKFRQMFSVMCQDYSRYQFTARDNIWLGNLERPSDDETIEPAVRQARLFEAASTWPKKYETPLGRWFEDGVELSTGEWQKVALARTIFRDSSIVLLDEPSSNLDAYSEREFFDSLRSYLRDKTALLVSHRFSTVRMANRIVVLDQGTVVEEGTHDQLVALGGQYCEMFHEQADMYR